MEATTDKHGNERIILNENERLWIDTPHGMIWIRVGFGGIHKITSFLPHSIDVKKETLRGAMQVTRLEGTYDSVKRHLSKVE